MKRERDLYLERLSEDKRVFKALGDSTPAFGMIGTLVGLVQMLANMDGSLHHPPFHGGGPADGALISNAVCLPLVDKLDSKFDVEELNQTLVIDGVMQIRESKSPAIIREMLIAYLPEKSRGDFQKAA